MPQILFIAEIPPNDAMSSEPLYSAAWRNFAKVLSDSTKAMKGARRLNESSWLIPADGAWSSLSAALSASFPTEISYSIFLISDEVVELTKSPSAAARVQSFNV